MMVTIYILTAEILLKIGTVMYMNILSTLIHGIRVVCMLISRPLKTI